MMCALTHSTEIEALVQGLDPDETGQTFAAWYAQPTDITIGKLKAWSEGRSAKHPNDIYAMVVFALSGLSDAALDLQAITVAAAQQGTDEAELWQSLLKRAESELQRLDEDK
jgi:hypothetical protein